MEELLVSLWSILSFCFFFKNLIEIYLQYLSSPLTSYFFYINHCYKHIQIYQHINKPVESLLCCMCVYVSKAGLLASYYQSGGHSWRRLILPFSTVALIICSSSSDGRAPSMSSSMPHSTSDCQLKLSMSSLGNNVTKISWVFLPRHCQTTQSHTDVPFFWLLQTFLVPFCEVSQILGTGIVL